MKYFYDRKSDSLYLTLGDHRTYADSVEVAPGIVLDFDDQGQLIGLDLERASRMVDVADLTLHEEPSGKDAETARLDGTDLRTMREELGLSQVELGRKLSVSPNTIARWERGELKIEHSGMLQLALRSLRSAPIERMQSTALSNRTPRTGGGKTVHTVPHGGGWANVRTGSARASSIHPTEAEPIRRGRQIAHKAGVEHVIDGMNGQIRDRDSYTDDPQPPKSDRQRDSRASKKK